MTKVLNRLAWVASLAMGFVATTMMGMLLSGEDMYDGDLFNVWLVFIIVFGSTFKGIFLSQNFINSHVSTTKNKQVPVDALESAPTDLIFKAESTISSHAANDNISTPLDDLSGNKKISQEINVVSPSERDINNAQKISDNQNDKAGDVIKEPSKPNFFQKFFQENALAKIGGILLFLGVMFLLQLVYTNIGPIGKLFIGFVLGFIIFGIGVWIDKKGYVKESRILIGTAILINYLVILSGRYLISDEMLSGQNFLSEGVTLLFLILNTIFAVVVSLVYQAHSLLFFSFVIAYLNPFLIGAQPSTTPYTLIGYSLIVSIGAIVLSYFYREKFSNYSSGLLNTAFVGGNVLVLLAPFSTNTDWLIKLAAMAFVSLLTLYAAYNNKQNEAMAQYFVLAYLFFAILLGFGNYKLGIAIGNLEIMIGYLMFLTVMLLSSVFVFSRTSISAFFYILFTPLIALIGLIYADILFVNNIIFVLMGTAFLYLIIFVRLVESLTVVMKYVFFIVLGLFILAISGFINGVQNNLSWYYGAVFFNTQVYGVMWTSFLFLLSAYYFSFRKSLEYLYSLGTVFGIFILLPVLTRDGDSRFFSIICIWALMFFNIAMPFINNYLIRSKIRNLVIGLLSGVLFAVGELFYFYFGEFGQSKITLGLSFLGLAIFYFMLGFGIYQKLRESLIANVAKKDGDMAKNVVYAFLGSSVSLFSLAIAYIFSKNSEIVAVIWLFEASLLYYFYKKTRDIKVYLAGFVLMLIGLVRLLVLLEAVMVRDFISLISLMIIFISLIMGLKFLDFENRALRFLHDFGHVFGMLLLFGLLIKIIPSHQYGLSMIGISTLFLLLFFVYGSIYNAGIKTFWSWTLSLVFIYHIFILNYIFGNLEYNNLHSLKILQYISTFIFAAAVYSFNSLMLKNKNSINYNKLPINVVSTALSFYLFIISTMYVYNFFNENSFVITIYWGILAFIFLSHGIAQNLIKFRTIGLYILSLTIGKILIYDIWSGLSDAVIRVVALMFVGGLMIVISILYTKKYGNNLKGEFNLENLKNDD